MIARQFDPVAELQSAFNLLMKNYMIAAIPLVSLIICFALFGFVFVVAGGTALLTGGLSDISSNPMALIPIVTAAFGWFFVAIVLALVISLIANGAAVAASESVWQGGGADIGAGFARALGRLSDLVILAIALFVICAVIGWTGIGLLAIIFFMMYTVPAVVTGGQSAFQAISTSWNIAMRNAGATFAALAGIVIVWVAALVVNMVIGHIPILGWFGSLVLNALANAYVALVVVRFYDLLKDSANAPAPPTPTS